MRYCCTSALLALFCFRPAPWPPGAENTSKDEKDAILLETERRRYQTRAKGGSSPVSTGGPRHVAVIMDGNRRFGRVKYKDPLKVISESRLYSSWRACFIIRKRYDKVLLYSISYICCEAVLCYNHGVRGDHCISRNAAWTASGESPRFLVSTTQVSFAAILPLHRSTKDRLPSRLAPCAECLLLTWYLVACRSGGLNTSGVMWFKLRFSFFFLYLSRDTLMGGKSWANSSSGAWRQGSLWLLRSLSRQRTGSGMRTR